MDNCEHKWISNSGKGGDPVFKPNSISRKAVMHVKCEKCNSRTWFGRAAWASRNKI